MFAASHEQLLQCPPRPLGMDRRWKSNPGLAPNCPRCTSPNTKFCYYNNYSLSQPRYFCKDCRRYWTKGGSLRNVPVGGGCRKNRRCRPPPSRSHIEPNSGTCSRSISNSDPSPSGTSGNSFTSTSGELMVQQNSEVDHGSDIDLAAVFAKFWNQNSGFEAEIVVPEFPDHETSAAFLGIPEATDAGVQLNDSAVESQKLPEFLGEFPDEVIIEAKMDHEPNGFGLQNLLMGENSVEDILWSDAPTLPNLTWQPMVQLHEYDQSLPSDDQLRISTNIMCDNWSVFDLSGL